MKSRSEVVAFIKEQMDVGDEAFAAKHKKMHYGYYELRQLLDFLYGYKPTREDELLRDKQVGRRSGGAR